MDTTFIYALCEPNTGEIRYIGKADDPHKRLNGHLCSHTLARNNHRSRWIKSLLVKGLKPRLQIIDEVPVDHWESIEAAYIDFCREQKYRLVNTADGGQGTAHWGHKFNLGRKQTPETIEKRMSQVRGNKHWLFGRHHGETTKRKMSEKKIGKKQTPEHARNAAKARTHLKSEVRFQEILRMLSFGKTQTEIGLYFGVTIQAIHNHLKRWENPLTRIDRMNWRNLL